VLLTSRTDLLSAAPSFPLELSFSLSYGVILPSSLTLILLCLSAFRTCPPVSVSCTVLFHLLLSWDFFPLLLFLLFLPLLCLLRFFSFFPRSLQPSVISIRFFFPIFFSASQLPIRVRLSLLPFLFSFGTFGLSAIELLLSIFRYSSQHSHF